MTETPQTGPSRQARRKALRDEAKMLRREGMPPVSEAPATSVEETSPPAPEAPLPRARSLVAAQPRGLALFAHRLLVTFGLRRRAVVPAEQGAIGQQLRALREELSSLQRSLDRMIEGVAG